MPQTLPPDAATINEAVLFINERFAAHVTTDIWKSENIFLKNSLTTTSRWADPTIDINT